MDYRTEDTKKFIEEIKKFTPAQKEAVEIVCEYIPQLFGSPQSCIYAHYVDTFNSTCDLMKNIENDTYFYYLIEYLKEDCNSNFILYVENLEKIYPEFLMPNDDGTSKYYDVVSAEIKKQLDEELAWDKWKKENPDYDEDYVF